MKRPWMPMYWGDYLADTPHFSRADHGAYLLLIAFYWCNGGLPDDDNAIRKIAKCSAGDWPKLKRLLSSKFSEGWKHKRIDAELTQAIERSEAAHARAMQRWQCKPQPQPHTHKKDKKEEVARASARGARLDKDWWPTEANIQYAIAHGLSLDRVSTEGEKFRNYWTAKAGQSATKVDWDATWQNWILKAAEQQEAGNGYDRPRRKSLVDIGNELADEARKLEAAAALGREDEPF